MNFRSETNNNRIASAATIRPKASTLIMLASVNDLPTARVVAKSSQFPVLVVVAFGVMAGVALGLAAFALGAF